MRALAQDELAGLSEQLEELTGSLPGLILPPLSADELSAILELQAGAGGDEASLFTEEISRMYVRYAASKGWKTTVLSKSEGNIGGDGLRDVALEIKGEGAYGAFKFEKGVHRVQRVPSTDSSGRIHTSTMSVVVSPSVNMCNGAFIADKLMNPFVVKVLPVAENTNETTADDVVNPSDVRVETMRARGAGGQVSFFFF